MPVSSFHGLNTTLRLLAHQRAIDTTGHNIANADTVGYSRQEATLGTTAGLKLPAGSANTGGQAMLGTGVRGRLPARARVVPRPPVPGPEHAARRAEHDVALARPDKS